LSFQLTSLLLLLFLLLLQRLSVLLRQLLSLLLVLLFQLLSSAFLRLLLCLLSLQLLSALLRHLLSLLLALLLFQLLSPCLLSLLLQLLSALLRHLLSLLLALLLFQLLSPCFVRLLFCKLCVIAFLLLLNALSFGRLLSKQLLLLLQMLTLEGGVCGARRRGAEDLRELLRVDRNWRGSATRACRARRPNGLTICTDRRRNRGSGGRMYHGRHGRRSKFHGRGDRGPSRRYAADCADAQRPSAILSNGFLAPLECRWRRGRRRPRNNGSCLYDRRRPRRGQSTSPEDCLLCGHHRRRHCADRCSHDCTLIDMHHVPGDRLCGRERLGRCRRDGAGYVAVDVV